MSRQPTFTQYEDLLSIIEKFGTDDECRKYLEELRWPDGVKCPRCASEKVSRIKARDQFDCGHCGYQFSVTVGTIFADSHLPLHKWFLAVYVIGESKKGISANQLKRMLHVNYRTAWYLTHRIRAAMASTMFEQLRGIIEADETFIGGHKLQWNSRKPSEAGKAMVLGAVERGGRARLRVSNHRTKANIEAFLGETVADDAEAIMTDAFPAYQDLGDEDTRHGVVNHSIGQWVQADVHTNTMESVWSLFKRSIVGSYHHLSVKHLQAYLDEFVFRYGNRENAYLFRDTVLRLIEAEPLRYAELVAS